MVKALDTVVSHQRGMDKSLASIAVAAEQSAANKPVGADTKEILDALSVFQEKCGKAHGELQSGIDMVRASFNEVKGDIKSIDSYSKMNLFFSFTTLVLLIIFHSGRRPTSHQDVEDLAKHLSKSLSLEPDIKNEVACFCVDLIMELMPSLISNEEGGPLTSASVPAGTAVGSEQGKSKK